MTGSDQLCYADPNGVNRSTSCQTPKYMCPAGQTSCGGVYNYLNGQTGPGNLCCDDTNTVCVSDNVHGGEHEMSALTCSCKQACRPKYCRKCSNTLNFQPFAALHCELRCCILFNAHVYVCLLQASSVRLSLQAALTLPRHAAGTPVATGVWHRTTLAAVLTR